MREMLAEVGDDRLFRPLCRHGPQVPRGVRRTGQLPETLSLVTPPGLIFAIHRLSTDDGPGLRNTIFLKGCGLRCAWCHNPESLSPQQEIWWIERKCIGARDCIRVCPEEALEMTEHGIRIDRDRCTACGLCVEACPSRAFEMIGKTWSVEALLAEALKERIFFKNSGGGVTLSGGRLGHLRVSPLGGD